MYLNRSITFALLVCLALTAQAGGSGYIGINVAVEGEGAAMGAALHARWVYENERGRAISLAEVAAPYVKLDESTRVKPNAQDAATYQTLSREFSALSARLRNHATTDDPFRLRKELVG